jgi:hypothetical protein
VAAAYNHRDIKPGNLILARVEGRDWNALLGKS